MAQSKQDRLRSVTAASIRALSGHVRGDVSYQTSAIALQPGQARISHSADNQPHIRMPDLDDNHTSALRGAGDSAALHLRHHDPAIHQRHKPTERGYHLLYDMLEQVRCEAVGSQHLKGVQSNITKAIETHCQTRGYADPGKSVAVPMEEGIALIAAEQLCHITLDKTATAAANEWRDWLARRNVQWNQLQSAMGNQDDFSILSRAVIEQINSHIPRDGSDTSTPDAEQNQQQDQHGEDTDEQGEETAQARQHMTQSIEMDGEDTPKGVETEGAAHDEAEEEGGDTPAPAEYTPQDHESDAHASYAAYTTQYDEIVDAKNLSDDQELERLRALLDNQLEPYQTLITRMANRLQRLLMAKQQRSWLFDQDDGWLDTRRLARIIADPNTQSTYKQEKETDFRDTCVSLLIDNSGSMRGRPIAVAALTTDILARTLERCGLKVEILGFTTSAWKGGQSRQEWMTANRPEKPGRLNDLRHIIYKAADTPWRRSRFNLGLMLKEGLLKENIDGEALQWAAKRLMRRAEERKILMIISDGAPVDDSTLSANHSDILETHLRTVIGDLEGKSPIDLLAIGIGHDVSRYYKRAVTIRDSADLGEVMINELSDLFT